MSTISELEPRNVWTIFEQITKVPRPSKREGKITAWLLEFAARHGLEAVWDQIGNITIRKPAGCAGTGKPTVILQSHVDMVCEKNASTQFDFDNDPIRPYIDNGWVKARGTTLGADDGIGMAAALALLLEQDEQMPPLEALFTVDEETGLTGAFGLSERMITGKYLINLDSEDEGEIFIGCAGGIDTIATFKPQYDRMPENHVCFSIDITGLKGGHSGDDIDKGLANANRVAARIASQIMEHADGRLIKIEGGNLRNAIPREASLVVAVPVDKLKKFFVIEDDLERTIRQEFAATEPDMDISMSETEAREHVMTKGFATAFIESLCRVPNGVLAMSDSMPGMVETSSNLASVKQGGELITVTTSQRSLVDSARYKAASNVEGCFAGAGAEVSHSDGYPGWNPDTGSHLLKVTAQAYRDLFGTEPKVRAIHAGLECGLFLQKYPRLEMVSFGPTIRGVHSPDEQLEIGTVAKFWDLLRETVLRV